MGTYKTTFKQTLYQGHKYVVVMPKTENIQHLYKRAFSFAWDSFKQQMKVTFILVSSRRYCLSKTIFK